jgi:hypothetical protein
MNFMVPLIAKADRISERFPDDWGIGRGMWAKPQLRRYSFLPGSSGVFGGVEFFDPTRCEDPPEGRSIHSHADHKQIGNPYRHMIHSPY